MIWRNTKKKREESKEEVWQKDYRKNVGRTNKQSMWNILTKSKMKGNKITLVELSGHWESNTEIKMSEMEGEK